MKHAESALLVAVLLLAAQLSAQAQQVRLSGTVLDSDGGVLPGVTVTLGCRCEDCPDPESCTCCPDERSVKVATTNARGQFSFEAQPGTYRVTATLEGFASAEKDGIELRPGSSVTIEITLESGGEIVVQ